jgi:acetyltransferase-like isoleucine patch superfamily enzyme
MGRRLAARAFLGLYRGCGRLSGKTFSVLAGAAFASFGKRSVLQPPVRLTGEKRIAIGSGVFVGSGSWLQVLAGVDEGIALTIGDRTSIAGQCVVSVAARVELGSDVLLARNVYIADHSHRIDDLEVPIGRQGIADVSPVTICDGAWLGQNVVVCPGVRIGHGAVVGANSVVKHDIPDHAVAVGAPARVVRELTRELLVT